MSPTATIAFLCLLVVCVLQGWKIRQIKTIALATRRPPRVDPMADRYTSRGTIRIFDGDQPVCHHVIPSEQQVLVELGWEAEGPSVGGVLHLHVKQATVQRDGTARWWRLYTSEGIGIKDAGITSDPRFAAGNMLLTDTELKTGMAIAIPSMTLSQAAKEPHA